MPSKQAPWLAPLIVSPEMKKRLEAAWAKVSASLGTPMPKTFFVRMLLERGMQSIEDASWPTPPTALAFDEGRKQATRKRRVGFGTKPHRKNAQ